MSKDLRKRKDEKFVRFAKEYQKKREDSRETWEQQPSNVAYLTTSRIVSCCCSMKRTYQNAVYAHSTMNTATYTLWLILN